jgi:hypothetical protein
MVLHERNVSLPLAGEQSLWELTVNRQQIVGGLLAYCFSLIPENGVLYSWQAIFIAYGVLSVFWGLFVSEVKGEMHQNQIMKAL